MNGDAPTELDPVALKHDLPAVGVGAGDVGTVVLVCKDGEAYEIEFVAGNGRTVAVETLSAREVEPFAGQQILHARRLAET